MQIIISECNRYISLTVRDISEDLSWEDLQTIKDFHFSDLDFIEVYPTNHEIINNANERHLIHQKGWKCPKLRDLDGNNKINIFEY